MRAAVPLVAILLALPLARAAAADDGGFWFRRTTPRAVVERSERGLALAVPGGRAWGVESELRALPAGGGAIVVSLEVDDPDVREAFVRVAYYGRLDGRPRQLAITDSLAVTTGERRLLVELDPPPGAIAYRVRVLARLRSGIERSAEGAVRARIGPSDTRAGALLTRLLGGWRRPSLD